MKNLYYAFRTRAYAATRVNLFLFKGVLFNTGGYSALYGQAMASALILESIDLHGKKLGQFQRFSIQPGCRVPAFVEIQQKQLRRWFRVQ